MIKRRQIIAAAIGLIAAAGCARLGIWQIHRLEQRRAFNARVEERTAAAPVPLAQLPHDTTELHYRRVHVTGRWDYDHEIALTSRSHNGSPGLDILTPLVMQNDSDAVLVNRGWVYSPDGNSVDFKLWRQGEQGSVVAYVELFPAPEERDARAIRNPRAWHRLDTLQMAAEFPYGLEPYYLVALPDSSNRVDTDGPVRLDAPDLGEGPHLGYAVQWFAFATIALVGAGILIWRDRPQR
jgi:surfeit locus 1 family protein